MTQSTDRDVVEKWAHIAMKLFPPQMKISVARENGEWKVCARWKGTAGTDSSATRDGKGVDLLFDEQSVKDYLSAGIDAQLQLDRFIEGAINDRLQSFDPQQNAVKTRRPDRWEISLERAGISSR